MILLEIDGTVHKLTPATPRIGREFEAIILEAEDFAQLAKLTPEALHNWLTHWQCGFKPTEPPCES